MTHPNVRKAYNSLHHLWRNELLFTYLTPPQLTLNPEGIKATTNSLEGGINAQLKLLARTHRGRSGEHQRRMLEWWLYLKTPLPDDPVTIARQQRWGQDALAKVTALTTTNENQADHETGRPALYDNAISNEYTHSVGIRKSPTRSTKQPPPATRRADTHFEVSQVLFRLSRWENLEHAKKI